MPQVFKLKEVAPLQERSLKTLVENRRVFTMSCCELNIFETFQQSALVPLTFNDFVVTSMLRGKKVMHLSGMTGFDYLPGETVLVPAQHTMKIDFPEATMENPTQCIALALDHAKIQKIVQRLNEDYPQSDFPAYWQLQHSEYHFQNNLDLAIIINKIIDLSCSTDPGKDILMDLSLKELVVRIIQSQHLNIDQQTNSSQRLSDPLSYVLHYIKHNLHQQFQVKELSDLACMSTPSFYRAFKTTYGLSPLDYILKEKIKMAKELLANPSMSITEICYELGFASLNYFDRQFRRVEGITPKQYRGLMRNVEH